jgi:hypothetical protein
LLFHSGRRPGMVLQMPILLEVDSKRGQVGSERASIELRRRLGVVKH